MKSSVTNAKSVRNYFGPYPRELSISQRITRKPLKILKNALFAFTYHPTDMLLGDTFKECIPMSLCLKIFPSSAEIVSWCFPKDTSCPTSLKLTTPRQWPTSVLTVPTNWKIRSQFRVMSTNISRLLPRTKVQLTLAMFVKKNLQQRKLWRRTFLLLTQTKPRKDLFAKFAVKFWILRITEAYITRLTIQIQTHTYAQFVV